MNDFWGTAVPNWIMAIGTILTACAVLFAWWSLRLEMRRDRAEAFARDRDAAERVTATWITNGPEWAVAVRNDHVGEIHDLELLVVGNANRGGDRIRRRRLVHGWHVQRSEARGASRAWSTPAIVEHIDGWQPVASDNHRIARIRFCRHGEGWQVDPGREARRMSDAELTEHTQALAEHWSSRERARGSD